MDLSRIPAQPKAGLLNVLIEIAGGSKNKYEFDKDMNAFALDRYGFSVQLRLWGEPLEPEAIQKDPKRWQRFRKHLGWQPREDQEFQPDIEGRLPEPVKSTLDFGDDALRDETNTFTGAAWLRRAQQCQLPPVEVSQQALNWQAEQTAAK